MRSIMRFDMFQLGYSWKNKFSDIRVLIENFKTHTKNSINVQKFCMCMIMYDNILLSDSTQILEQLVHIAYWQNRGYKHTIEICNMCLFCTVRTFPRFRLIITLHANCLYLCITCCAVNDLNTGTIDLLLRVSVVCVQ